MVLLLILLLLGNLLFGWAVDSSGTSSPPGTVPDYGEILKQWQTGQKTTEEVCRELKGAIGRMATSNNWEVKTDQNGVMTVKLPNGETYVINKDCRVVVQTPKGTLNPAHDAALSSLPQGMLMAKDFKFQVDVSLFKMLFQMLMYAAAIFWAVRSLQKLIAGELTETLINFLIGVIIIASMYMLYWWIR